MWPIIKVRLRKVQRAPLKNFLQFMCPTIMVFLLALINIFLDSEGLRETDDETFLPTTFNLPGEVTDINATTTLFALGISMHGVVCEDQTIRNEYQNIFMELKGNTTLFFYQFKDTDQLNEFMDSKNYTDSKLTFTSITEISLSNSTEAVSINGNKYEFKLRLAGIPTNQDSFLTEKLVIGSNTLLSSNSDFDLDLDIFNRIQFELIRRIENKTNFKNYDEIEINYIPMKAAAVKNFFSDENMVNLLPFFVVILNYFTFISFVLWIVGDKEAKLDEFLARQGINQFKYFLSWFFTFLIFTILGTILNAVFISVFFMYHTLQLFFIIFAFQFFFSLNLFAMAFFFQAVLNTVASGQTILKVIYIGLSFVSLSMNSDSVPRIPKLLFGLFPQITEMYNLEVLLKIDNIKAGLDFNLFKTAYRQVSLQDTTILFAIDFVIFILVAYFIMGYKKCGTDFFSYTLHVITFGFYKLVREEDEELEPGQIEEAEKEDNNKFEVNHQEPSALDLEMQSKNDVLKIKNITKRFGPLIAVNKFNATISSDQIFCLLGHNGAGKSTLISIISGLLDPEKGDIELLGHSLITEKSYLYSNIGLCSQEDIFFEDLTVEQHLQYMSEIKSGAFDKNEFDDIVKKIGLDDCIHSICKELSGGNKRKLCVALSLIGKSKLVLLDEPTSGMDVFAKRDLWKFLKNFKKDRILILTTHSLDEAEYLGDRIGIMSEGRYICSGTSSYLKSVYPCGFNINMLINSEIMRKKEKRRVYKDLRKIEKSAIVKISSKSLLSINFLSNVPKEKIEKIFEYINSIGPSKGIENYTVSSTTLEDVFIKLNSNELSQEMADKKEAEAVAAEQAEAAQLAGNPSPQIEERESDLSSRASEVSVRNDDVKLLMKQKEISFGTQFTANFKRVFLTLWRSKSHLILELFSSLIVLVLVTFFMSGGEDIIDASTNYRNANAILKKEKIHFYSSDPIFTLDYLTNSPYFKDIISNKVGVSNFKELTEPFELEGIESKSITQIDEEIFSKSKYHNERLYLIIYRSPTEPRKVKINILYQFNTKEYFNLALNFILSAVYKNEYEIDSIFINQYMQVFSELFAKLAKLAINLVSHLITSFLIWYSIISIGGILLANPLNERVNNIKHLYFLSGGNLVAYWINNYLVDLVKMAIFFICLLPFLPFYNDAYINQLALYFPFMFSLIPLCYVFSFLFEKVEDASKFFLIFSFVTGIGFVVLAVVIFNYTESFIWYLDLDGKDHFIISFADITPASSFLVALFRIVFIKVYLKSGIVGKAEVNMTNVVLNHTLYLMIHGIIGILLIILGESNVIGKCYYNWVVRNVLKEEQKEQAVTLTQKNPENISMDTMKESQTEEKAEKLIEEVPVVEPKNEEDKNIDTETIKQIQKQKIESKPLTTKIIGLNKTYFTFCGCGTRNKAVKNLYLGLEGNEKFGLLGFNGSGKTTTFRAITNSMFYDSGEIVLFGYNTKTQFNNVRNHIGYCPQENAYFDYLTVKECLTFYLDLKSMKDDVVEIAEKFGLGKFLKTKCKNLSGGNKRKLIFAIAVMQEPEILLLDEPSTGVDPESRRVMWRNINALKHEYNLVLSTHSMEEAEVLCDTVGWLRLGEFMCIGNPEQLKLQLSDGYILHVKFINEKYLSKENQPKSYDDLFKENRNWWITNGGKAENFDLYINENKALLVFFENCKTFVETISQYCSEISMTDILQDGSFEIGVKINEEKKSDLFTFILNVKTEDKSISEISLNLDSLENVLTKFH